MRAFKIAVLLTIFVSHCFLCFFFIICRKGTSLPEQSWPWKARSQILTFHDFEFNVTEYARRDPDAKIEQDEDQTESDQIDTSR